MADEKKLGDRVLQTYDFSRDLGRKLGLHLLNPKAAQLLGCLSPEASESLRTNFLFTGKLIKNPDLERLLPAQLPPQVPQTQMLQAIEVNVHLEFDDEGIRLMREALDEVERVRAEKSCNDSDSGG